MLVNILTPVFLVALTQTVSAGMLVSRQLTGIDPSLFPSACASQCSAVTTKITACPTTADTSQIASCYCSDDVQKALASCVSCAASQAGITEASLDQITASYKQSCDELASIGGGSTGPSGSSGSPGSSPSSSGSAPSPSTTGSAGGNTGQPFGKNAAGGKNSEVVFMTVALAAVAVGLFN
ncbi:hypothetical protein BDN72DRAFT_893999 [Pluteus cervinus]|uniref:Uncharacterized protein n=1 Tax=Pluteus cervinus TaxID=181527 RepID=A0ACD3B5J1_9AGAR|nr:hypothetical protein BDN72DRAFT_893999 [Pluteus cervinus]